MQQVCMEAPHQPSKTVFRPHETNVFRNGPGPSKVEKLIEKAALLELILVPTVAKLHKIVIKRMCAECVRNLCGICAESVPDLGSTGGSIGWSMGALGSAPLHSIAPLRPSYLFMALQFFVHCTTASIAPLPCWWHAGMSSALRPSVA